MVLGCSEDPTTAAVGLSCLPRDEFAPGFAGFYVDEVTIETANDDCAAESVCLVHNFRGRVSCPYGQTEADLALPSSDERRCVVPKYKGAPVELEVMPQLVQTAGTKGVYCSALCADIDGKRNGGRSYHDCPNGYHCEPLDNSLLTESNSLHGSYCIRDDTPTKATLTGLACDASNPSANCGDPRPFE